MLYFSVYHAHVIDTGKVIIAEAACLCIIFTPTSLELYFSAGMGTLCWYGIFCPECLGLGSFPDKGIFCILKQNA